MITNDLQKNYDFSFRVLLKNLDGIDHEDSLVIPGKSGNCINWILNHVLDTRKGVLRLAGADFSEKFAALPKFDAYKPFNAEEAVELEDLKELFQESQDALMAALDKLEGDRLDKKGPSDIFGPDTTLGQMLMLLNYHESYHTGQVGLLRRILGKEGVIKAPKS